MASFLKLGAGISSIPDTVVTMTMTHSRALFVRKQAPMEAG